MDNNQRLYDFRAKIYADEWYPNNLILPTIKDFLGIINRKQPKILDLGCGPGNESMRLSNEGAEVVGIDFSKGCIKIAKERNPKSTFYEMDFFTINETIGIFDGIFAYSSLIHLKESELEKLLDIIKKILKPKGLFLDLYLLGEGQRITYPEIEGEKIERICERRNPDKLNELYKRHGYSFIKNAELDQSQIDNWRATIYQLNN